MIGRYKDLSIYRQLLQMREFYAIALGIILIILSFILGKRGVLFYPDLLAICALVLLGGPIILGALKGIMRKELNVDELVSLAIVASVLIGEYLSAAVVALIMVSGSLLEQFTAQKARSAIDSLIRLAPDQATVIQDGMERVVQVKEICTGDRLLIRLGEKIPVDGIVIKGDASIDQASLTGESAPVSKSVSDTVYAGTVIYLGMLEVEVQKTGEDTTLGKLIDLVQEAENQKAPVLRISDRYARYFTPAIIALGIVVYLVTKDAYRAITVLIVGCPCAFILASPTAIVSALGNASKNGILIKGGDILEEASRINAVLFDKTGTLTTGRPKISAIDPLNGTTQDFILATAAAVEKYSTHPLARAILELAEQKQLSIQKPRDFKDLPGRGVEAVMGDKKYTVATMHEHELDKYVQNTNQNTGGQVNKAVAVFENNTPIGLIYFVEEVRQGIETIVEQLKDTGISKIQMITGDENKVAAQIAKKAGIEDYFSGVLPEEKLQQVKKLKGEGYKVAMVGDGVNDAPSLAAAHIGISMGAMGTDAAIEAADVALMGDDLTKTPYFFNLGKVTVRTINFNIFFAMAFNVLALIASSAGLLNPISGAIAHNVGSIIVVINSARLINTKFAHNKLFA